jgi:hypothetical protein
MAHHEEQPTAIESVLELLSEHGLGAMAEAMQTLLNEAMKLERSDFLLASRRASERTIVRATRMASRIRRCAPASESWRCVCRRRDHCRAASRSASTRNHWNEGYAASARIPL